MYKVCILFFRPNQYFQQVQRDMAPEARDRRWLFLRPPDIHYRAAPDQGLPNHIQTSYNGGRRSQGEAHGKCIVYNTVVQTKGYPITYRPLTMVAEGLKEKPR